MKEGRTANDENLARLIKICLELSEAHAIESLCSVGEHLTSAAGVLAQIAKDEEEQYIRYLKSKDEENEQSIRYLESRIAEKEQYIRYLMSKDAEKKQSIQELRERVGKLELERSVGAPVQSEHHVSESTGSVPTPLPTPPTFSFGTASYAKSADVAAPGPTTATASSAPNPFNSFN